MKRLFLISSLVLVFCATCFAQVTGNAFLEGATDHAGIKVKFVAQSPTSKTDSTYTLSDGSYSINLNGGVYIIVFKKDEIEDSYDKGAAKLVLQNQVLSDIIVSNTIYVSGTVSGPWIKKKKYRIVNDINLFSGDSLIIEPGTIIQFDGPFSFTINNNSFIKAVGTAENKITFTSQPRTKENYWKGIDIPYGKGIFKNCTFEYFSSGIRAVAGNGNLLFEITDCEFRYFVGTAIATYHSTSKVENNTIHDFESGCGILAHSVISPVRCNSIFNGTESSYGIIANSNFEVSNNYIHNIDEIGIHCQYGVPDIKGNYIEDVKIGIDIRNYFELYHAGPIINNIISNCSQVAIKYDNSGQIKKHDITNNIVMKSRIAVSMDSLSEKYVTSSSVVNNIFFSNSINFKFLDIPSIGEVISSNNNGDLIDSYFNLYQDPLLIDNSLPILLPNSPAKKAGLNGEDIGFDITGTCLEKYFITRRNVSDTLSISGTVHQGSSKLGAGTVMAINKTTNLSYYGAVSANGTFKIDSIPAGNYILKAIPTSPLSNSYANTYYPNKTEESQAVTLALAGIIIDVDIYLALINGIEDGTINDWSVSPNPFTDQLVISSTSQISILDVIGNVVYTGTPTDKLDTSNWKAGLYILKNKNKAQKVIKY